MGAAHNCIGVRLEVYLGYLVTVFDRRLGFSGVPTKTGTLK